MVKYPTPPQESLLVLQLNHKKILWSRSQISTPPQANLVVTWSNIPFHQKIILGSRGQISHLNARKSCGLMVKYPTPPQESLVVLQLNQRKSCGITLKYPTPPQNNLLALWSNIQSLKKVNSTHFKIFFNQISFSSSTWQGAVACEHPLLCHVCIYQVRLCHSVNYCGPPYTIFCWAGR